MNYYLLLAIWLITAMQFMCLNSEDIHVVLFPYIPDTGNDGFASLKAEIIKRFNSLNTGFNLKITIDPYLDLYNFDTLSELLSQNDSAAQIVEVDTIILADLVEKNLIQPTPYIPYDIIPNVIASQYVNKNNYGIPTYICTNVVYSTDQFLQTSVDGESLIRNLKNSDPNKIPLVGNYKGSWTLPGYYIDAWADGNSNDPRKVQAALYNPIQQSTIDTLKKVIDSCKSGDSNPCLDGTYKNVELPAAVFAKRQANGYIGYTEHLNYILTNNPSLKSSLKVLSAPIGNGQKPVVFVDTLVFNSNCKGDCINKASIVSKFLTSPSIRNLIAFSQDAGPNSVPRYLLQSNLSFYNTSPAVNDKFYQSFYQLLLSSLPLPNKGFADTKRKLNEELTKALSS